MNIVHSASLGTDIVPIPLTGVEVPFYVVTIVAGMTVGGDYSYSVLRYRTLVCLLVCRLCTSKCTVTKQLYALTCEWVYMYAKACALGGKEGGRGYELRSVKEERAEGES